MRKRRADFWEQFAADLERNAQLGNAGEAHRMLRTLYKPREACATHFATLFAPLSAEQEAARAANPPLATPPAPRPRTRAATEQRRCVTAAICGCATAADRQHPGRASYAVHFPNGEYPDVTERAWGPQSTARGEICALLHCLEMTKTNRDDLHLVVGATGIPGNLRRITDLAEGDFGDVDHADLWREVRLIIEGERRVTCTRVQPPDAAQTPEATACRRAAALARTGTAKPDLAAAAFPANLNPVAHLSIEDGVPTRAEVDQAIGELHDTAPGPDGIRAADIRACPALADLLV